MTSTAPGTSTGTSTPATGSSGPGNISSTPTATGPGTSGAGEGGGIMGFLRNNSGMLIGGLIGAVIMMMTGGGGMGMLFPIIGALLVGMLGDSNGMLSGVREAILPSRTPGASGPGGSGPAVNPSTPGVGAAPSVAPAIPPVTIAANSELIVRNSTGVISSVAVNGQPSFSAPTGSGPAARGPDIEIVENAPLASGATTAAPAFRYTGRVEGDNFVITSVQAVIPGTNPPQMGLPSRPTPPVSLPIDANGKINFNQPATTPPTGLAAARTQAMTTVANRNNTKNFELTELGGNRVSVTLDPVVRDGVSYQTTVVGTRAADGTVTFDRATMKETSGTPPTTRDVTNPRTGGTEFEVTGFIPPVRSTAATPPATRSTVAITQGEAGNTTEAMVDFTLRGRQQLEAAQATARGQRNTELVGAINSAPNANQALNNLESTLSRQFTRSGMNPFDASIAAERVAVFYTESDNRGAALDEAELRTQLQAARRTALNGGTGDRIFTDDQVNAIIAETRAHHTQIVAGINGKPLFVAPGASGPAPATAGTDIPRMAPPLASPSAGVPINPSTAIPGLVPPSSLNPGR